MRLLYVSEHSKHFFNLLRNWYQGENPPTLVGQIPKFNNFFKGFPN